MAKNINIYGYVYLYGVTLKKVTRTRRPRRSPLSYFNLQCVGTCLQFRSEEAIGQKNKHIDAGQLHSLSLLVGFNESDSTYGWSDARDSLTVYYTMLPLEHSHHHQSDHSHTLVPILSTEVQIKLETTMYKNKPYTPCNDAKYYTQRKKENIRARYTQIKIPSINQLFSIYI